MIKNIVLYKIFSNIATGTLSLSSIATPGSLLLLNDSTTTETNAKRTFNSTEETGLDYNVDGKKNPFEYYDCKSGVYDLDEYFYTKQNYQGHTNYHSLEWKDLNDRSKIGLSNWLSKVCNWLKDDTNYNVQVKADQLTSPDDFVNYDYSSKQASNMSLKWQTSQWGFGGQTDQSKYWKEEAGSSAKAVFPAIIHNGDETTDIIWTNLTGSDFYTNYAEKQDPNTRHAPHTFDKTIQYNLTTADYDTWQQSSSSAKTPTNISGTKEKFDFPQLWNSSASADNSFSNLSDIINVTGETSSVLTSKINIPPEYKNFAVFAFDSDFTATEDNNADVINILFTDSKEEGKERTCVLKDHNFSDDIDFFNNPTSGFGGFQEFFKGVNVAKGTNFCYYIPSLASNVKSASSLAKQEILLQLPKEQSVTVPGETGTTSAYLNFSDYYNTKSSSALNCDIDIDKNNKITYTFKSGSNVIKTVTETVDNTFKDFLNMCLSSMATKTNYINIADVRAETSTEAVAEKLKESSCVISSSNDNGIINLHTNLSGSGNLNTQVPFSQVVSEETGSNTVTAQSYGIGFSPSSKGLTPVHWNYDPTSTQYSDKQSAYAMNFVLMSNKTSLKASTNGDNNNTQANLDYLLAINPTTTNFYQKEEFDSTKDNSIVKVGLNPYYLQSAANAYSAYNFWLQFQKDKSFEIGTNSSYQVKNMFRDWIMRGFIKTKAQADKIYNNWAVEHPDYRISQIVPLNWKYSTGLNDTYLNSYTKLNASTYIYEPCSEFLWDIPSFNIGANGIWVDADGNSISKGTNISQSTWAPFCWQYGISPQTWSFLKAIPQDYTFTVPASLILPSDKWNSGSCSGAAVSVSKDLKWSELLQGSTFDFNIPEMMESVKEGSSKTENWNNVSLMVGSNLSSIEESQGIHAKNPSDSYKTVTNSNGETINITMPSFGNIKLATITSGSNHIDATGESYDNNIIQNYKTSSNRNTLLKTNSTINYLDSSKTHSCLALQKADAKITLDTGNNLSNNTYVVTKVNSKKFEWQQEGDYITIDSDGTLGIIANFSNWRKLISEINTDKYYHSVNTEISGTQSESSTTWLMDGVAPEDWFNDSYKVTFNGYKTYKWAFHPTGLWAYNMQFHQDIDKEPSSTTDWDDMSQQYGLDYSLWGRPSIQPIEKGDYVPATILAEWSAQWKQQGYKSTPVYYTNNATHELAFKVVYSDLKFQSEEYNDQWVTPIQYVYIPDCFYKMGFEKTNDEASAEASVNDYVKINNQYGDYAPTALNHWENYDITKANYSSSSYSTSQIKNVLCLNELVNFYNSSVSNGVYKSNLTVDQFVTLYKNGWICINPSDIKADNENHKLTFKIYYYKNFVINEDNTIWTKINPDYDKTYNPDDETVSPTLLDNKMVKIPNLSNGNWLSTDSITLTDFRCVGTEWSTVSSGTVFTPFVIGMIVACCIIPVLITVTGIVFKRIRTKYKRVK